jgi:hypothetical protein
VSAIWIVSSLLQWLVITLLSIVVVVLLQHHGRSLAGDEPAEPVAPRPGMVAPARSVPHAGRPGRMVTVGGIQDVPQLHVFYSSNCTPCRSTQDAVEELAGAGGLVGTRLVVVLADARASALGYLETGVLADLDVVLLEDFPAELFPGSTPSAVAVRPGGRVAEIGRPHNRSDLATMADRLAAPERITTGGRIR